MFCVLTNEQVIQYFKYIYKSIREADGKTFSLDSFIIDIYDLILGNQNSTDLAITYASLVPQNIISAAFSNNEVSRILRENNISIDNLFKLRDEWVDEYKVVEYIDKHRIENKSLIKILEFEKLFETFSIKKAEEVLTIILNGSKEDANRFLVFSGINLTTSDKGKLIQKDYSPICSRIDELYAYEHYNEVILIGILFLKDDEDTMALYDKSLNIKDKYFMLIVYCLCEAILKEKMYDLCQPYVVLLLKLTVIYPEHLSLFQKNRVHQMYSEIQWDN